LQDCWFKQEIALLIFTEVDRDFNTDMYILLSSGMLLKKISTLQTEHEQAIERLPNCSAVLVQVILTVSILKLRNIQSGDLFVVVASTTVVLRIVKLSSHYQPYWRSAASG
jgi:DNA integrity scanning protein DisA with diadenylate cyclase activity